MNISVFGIGYVGCISLGCLASEGHNIIGVDTNEDKIELINSGFPTVLEKDIEEKIHNGVSKKKIIATSDFKYAVARSKISIICVGTPVSKKGNLDLSHLIKVAEQIALALKGKNEFHIVSIRSSVPPGSVEKIEKIIADISGKLIDKDFSVLANPEFLREGSAVNDYYNPPYTLIGGRNKTAMKKLASIYKKVKAEIIYTEPCYAEMIKFVNNSFHALKIGFANEVGNICKAVNIDSRKLMQLFTMDTKLNISSSYFIPGFAYGGSCLPKDLEALQNLAGESNIDTPLLSSVSASNNVQIEKAFNIIKDTGKKSIGFAGITFKEGTDDVRNSPYVSLIKKLVNNKFFVKIFDSNIKLENILGANKEYLFKELPLISDYLVHSVKNLIEESEVIVIANSKFITKKDIQKNKNKFIVDLIGTDENLRTKDKYIGLCW